MCSFDMPTARATGDKKFIHGVHLLGLRDFPELTNHEAYILPPFSLLVQRDKVDDAEFDVIDRWYLIQQSSEFGLFGPYQTF